MAAFICVNFGPFSLFQNWLFCEIFPEKLFEKTFLQIFSQFLRNDCFVRGTPSISPACSVWIRYLILVIGLSYISFHAWLNWTMSIETADCRAENHGVLSTCRANWRVHALQSDKTFPGPFCADERASERANQVPREAKTWSGRTVHIRSNTLSITTPPTTTAYGTFCPTI